MMNSNKKISNLNRLKLEFQVVKERWHDPALKAARKRRAIEIGSSLLRGFLLFGLCFIILLPIFQKFTFALRAPEDIADPQIVWIPATISKVNITIALELLRYRQTVVNTTIMSFINMVIQIIATAIAGYSFARLRFKGSNVIFFIVLLTLVVPNDTLHIARFLKFSNTTFLGIKLMGNIFALYIMSAFGMGIRSAIFIYIFRQFFRNIPIELEESAQIDGAGVIRTFWSVMLPNARGAIVTVGLFAFVWQWNDWYFANLFRVNNKVPLLATQLAGAVERLDSTIISRPDLARLVGTNIRQNPLFFGLVANTAALFMMLPLLIGYFFVQKLFVESIERTGITGM